MSVVELHAVFKGRVQGVGFRATVRYHALQLGLKGTARNCDDGSVEISVQGEKAVIEDLLKRIQVEFHKAIQSVECEYVDCSREFSTFSIY